MFLFPVMNKKKFDAIRKQIAWHSFHMLLYNEILSIIMLKQKVISGICQKIITDMSKRKHFVANNEFNIL